MALELQRGRSPYWYARISIPGLEPVCTSLKIRVEGKVPARLDQLGDLQFERSRARAMVAHNELEKRLKDPVREQELLKKIYEAKTRNRAIPTIRLDEMSERWKATEKRSERYVSVIQKLHQEFIDYVQSKDRSITTMAEVTEELAKEFMGHILKQNFAPGTYNGKLDGLRSTFNCLAKAAGIFKNPFDEIEELEEDIINRIPFPSEELERILAIARNGAHQMIYPALVIASMTAMREGDCCCLAWSSVDTHANTVRVKMGKTKKTIQIPMAPLLSELISQTPKSTSPFIFPELAERYRRNPTAITELTRAVLKEAGYYDPMPGEATPLGPVTVMRADGAGKRRVSVRDFHSFRASWVTIALNSGVPIELVCRVTGHRSLDTLQKHYYRPSIDDLRRVLTEKMPASLGGKTETTRDSANLRESLIAIRAKLDLMTADNWQLVHAQISDLVAKAIA